MKYIYPKLLVICLAVAIYCNNKSVKSYKSSPIPDSKYTLTVKRGAFHYDRFDISKNKVQYTPDTSDEKNIDKYNKYSETFLDTLSTLGFFKKIEADGFWNLKPLYETKLSCGSKLTITLSHNKKTKTVICEDYIEGCPEVIKYIDKKVVEMEGNSLKRIYLPG